MFAAVLGILLGLLVLINGTAGSGALLVLLLLVTFFHGDFLCCSFFYLMVEKGLFLDHSILDLP